MANMGIWQLLLVVAIVVLLFGTKKLRNLGGDLGSAIKGFKKAVTDDEPKKNVDTDDADSIVDKTVVEKTVEQKEKDQV